MSTNDLFDRANTEWDVGKHASAFRLFSQAAAAGHASAQNSLGYFYFHGIAVARDEKKALFWYRKAARGRDVSAYKNLALMYRDAGKIRQAKAWFAKAVARRDGDAALELAKLWLGSARRTKRNIEQGHKYLTIAAQSKYILSDSRKEAQKLLRELMHNPRRPRR